MVKENKVKLYFELEPEQWHKHATESVWALAISNDKFKIENIPAFAFGTSLGDVVKARYINGELFFDSTIMHSGHSTYRIILTTGDDEEFEKYWKPIIDLGCSFEGFNHGIKVIAIDVPPSVDIYKVYSLLEEGEAADVWSFDEGHCGHTLTS